MSCSVPSSLVGVVSLGYSGQLVEIDAVAVVGDVGGQTRDH